MTEVPLHPSRSGRASDGAVLGAGIPNAPTGGWRTATVAGVRRPIQRSVELRLDVADRVDHVPGQHYVVRLTAEDGYTAQRSYSVASAPGDPLVELFVERLDDGEVSTFLADVVEPGDELEVRGPIGGWFVWDGETPALLLAGGYGVVPFIAMLRHAKALGREDLLRIAVSSRTMAELPYAEELLAAGALIVLTREAHGIRPGRPADRGRAGAAVGAGSDRLRLRLGVLRRVGQPDPGRPGDSGRRHPGRAVRPERADRLTRPDPQRRGRLGEDRARLLFHRQHLGGQLGDGVQPARPVLLRQVQALGERPRLLREGAQLRGRRAPGAEQQLQPPLDQRAVGGHAPPVAASAICDHSSPARA